MFFEPQSPMGLGSMDKSERTFSLKIGQVVSHIPSVNQVTVKFDGGETADTEGKATADKVNTRNVTCNVGASVANYTSGSARLPPLFSWVVVGMVENTDESPVVLTCVHDDFTHILGTLPGDGLKVLWHHSSDTTFLIDKDGKTEFVHPSGLKGVLFHDAAGIPAFTQHFRQIRNDYNRELKGVKKQQMSDPDKPWEQFDLYESPDGEWFKEDPGGGAWNYGPESGSRDDDSYDHRMVETPGHKAYLRIEHPAKGDDWLEDPTGSGGEYGANYQLTQSYIEWNGDGEFKLHIDEFIFAEMYKDGKISLHADESNYFLEIDPTGEKVTLSAKDGEVLAEFDAGADKVTITAKAGEVFLEMDATAAKVTLQAKAGTEHLILDGTAGEAELYATTSVRIGNVAAIPLWTVLMDPLWNTHFHYNFLGIPTTPPDASFLVQPPWAGVPPAQPFATQITKAA